MRLLSRWFERARAPPLRPVGLRGVLGGPCNRPGLSGKGRRRRNLPGIRAPDAPASSSTRAPPPRPPARSSRAPGDRGVGGGECHWDFRYTRGSDRPGASPGPRGPRRNPENRLTRSRWSVTYRGPAPRADPQRGPRTPPLCRVGQSYAFRRGHNRAPAQTRPVTGKPPNAQKLYPIVVLWIGLVSSLGGLRCVFGGASPRQAGRDHTPPGVRGRGAA